MISKQLLTDIQLYIDNNLIFEDSSLVCGSILSDGMDDLRERIENIDEGFSQFMLRKIDELGITDADCYKKAQLNRSHFNKIKNDPAYNIRKSTAIAIGLALELDRDTFDELIEKAGYALSNSSIFDLVICYCIEHQIYDVLKVNEILSDFEQDLLGAGLKD